MSDDWIRDVYVRPGDAQFTLTEQEAYAAVELFITQFLSRGAVDMPLLSSWIHTEPNGETHDPAQWHDWLECVRLVKGAQLATESDTWTRVPRLPAVHRL